MKPEENDTFIEDWAKLFDSSKSRHPLQDDMSLKVLLIQLAFHEQAFDRNENIIKEIESGKQGLVSVIYNRINNGKFSFRITPTAVALMGSVLKSFGESTMIVAYLAYKAKQTQTRLITLQTLNAMLPDLVIPNEEEFRNLWELQKIKPHPDKYNPFTTDNGLDITEHYQSLKF
jgi:hypothetical protein